jgi:hypothetical protein
MPLFFSEAPIKGISNGLGFSTLAVFYYNTLYGY